MKSFALSFTLETFTEEAFFPLQPNSDLALQLYANIEDVRLGCVASDLAVVNEYNPRPSSCTNIVGHASLSTTKISDITSTGVYKVFVNICWFTPDNFRSMFHNCCLKCYSFNISDNKCLNCDHDKAFSDLLFSLNVLDITGGTKHDIIVCGTEGRKFLEIPTQNSTQLQLSMLDRLDNIVDQSVELLVYASIDKESKMLYVYNTILHT